MAKRKRGLVDEPPWETDEENNEKTIKDIEDISKRISDATRSNLPLHTKLRPSGFDSFLGNTSTINSIKSKLAQKALHHSILLQGPSGCGKTTIARILKAELNCSDFDFVEINMGNIGGVATAREIIRNVKLRPMQGNCRIYLLDECQQATKDFQNALLKPLEDTPSYAYFILCTTDPQKLLITIRNRCAIYEVNPLVDSDMIELIERTAEEEDKQIDDEVVTDVMIAADGCPRQAMVILDQIIDLDPRRQRRAIKSFIGHEAATLDLCQALLRGDAWGRIQSILNDLGDEPEKVRRAVIGYMSAVALKADETKKGMRKVVKAAEVFNHFEKAFYDSGKPGLTFACWKAVAGDDIPY